MDVSLSMDIARMASEIGVKHDVYAMSVVNGAYSCEIVIFDKSKDVATSAAYVIVDALKKAFSSNNTKETNNG